MRREVKNVLPLGRTTGIVRPGDADGGNPLRPFAVAVLLAFAPCAGAPAATYDMDRFLGEPHPFAIPPAYPPPAVRPVPALRRTPPAISAPAAPPAPSARPPASADREDDILSEVRLGGLAHDQGPFSSNKEYGFDINVEVLFVSPDFLDVIFSPRPHAGLTLNSAGDSSQAYLGLSWEWDFWDGAFAGFSLGGAVHDGETTNAPLDRKELGCSVLFRESIDFGYRLDKTHSLMVHLNHISNAKLCDTNEDLENVGIRYGYRF